MIIKVVSLWNPWAWAMWNGLKEWETRSDKAPVVAQLRGYEGPLGIHAAQISPYRAIEKTFNDDRKLCMEWFDKFMRYANDWPEDRAYRGVLGGICHFSGIYQTHQIAPKLSEREIFFGNYSEGRRALHCPGMVKLPAPIPMRGMQGVWNWEAPQEIEDLLAQREGSKP